MADLSGFDANAVEPQKPFEPIPAGKYPAVITDSAYEANSKRTGHYLKLTFEIIDGQFKGKKQFARLNLDNPNAQAVQIAKAELSAICRAVGVMVPNDSVDLHNLPLVIQVRCKKRDDTGDITNEIAGYVKKESPTAAAAAGGHQQSSVEAFVMLDFELPYPPSINHYWRRVGLRTLISREGRRFREQVVSILAGRRIEPMVGPLAIEVEVHPPDQRRRDIDNVQKALLDALGHGGAFQDDSQIVRLQIAKRDPVDGGKTWVRIRHA